MHNSPGTPSNYINPLPSGNWNSPRGEKSSSRSTCFLLSIYPRDIRFAYPRSDRGYVADQNQLSAFSEDCMRETWGWWKNKKKEKKNRGKNWKKPKFQRIVIGSKLEPHSSSTPSSLFIPYREMSFGMRNMKENVYGIRVYMDDK